MTRAYRKGDTVVVASPAYGTVVFGSLLDGLIWNERWPAAAWPGVVLTVAAGVRAVYLNKKKESS